MARQTNVEGLRKNAQKKRQEALEKVDKGIQQLIKEKRTINFNTVATASGVSKAYLYKEPDIKARIEKLRQKYTGPKKLPVKQRASDGSKNAIIQTLRERIKKLEAENRELRRQNEVSGGQMLLVSELRQKLARCKAENERLRQRKSDPEPKQSIPILSKQLESQIAELGIRMNSTLKQIISDAPVEIVQKAVDALKGAMASGNVENPAGFLNRAIREAWQPNADFEAKTELDLFNQWYPKVKEKGLVMASQQIEGKLYIVKPNGECVAFEEMIEVYPLESIQELHH